MAFLSALGLLLSFLALVGVAHHIWAVIAARCLMTTNTNAAKVLPPLTLLKPLHGAEVQLAENLESFCLQDYPAPVQIVFGVQDAADAAIPIVEDLRRRHPALDIALVIDPTMHGANRKISNLVNMQAAAKHNAFVMSDADMAVPPDYLSKIAAALEVPSVGAVTCLYTGYGVAGTASRMSAMGINYDFLPNVLVGVTSELAEPCFGSTIALSRETLASIGGLVAFADYLADDYEIGRAVRARGLHVVIPPLALHHACTEPTLWAWLAHELRWDRTTRTLAPLGHRGSIVTHPLPLALLAVLFSGFTLSSCGVLAISFAARFVLKKRIDRFFGTDAGPFWLLPLRDVLSFAVFLTSLFGGKVEWRGERLTVAPGGTLSKA